MKQTPYTIKELIERLKQEENQDRVIVSARDEEGNGYRLVYGVGSGSYLDGEFGLEELTKEDEKYGYSEEDIIDGQPAFCIG